MEDEERAPLEQVLDVVLYAPVGLFLAARDGMRKSLPGLIAAGRDQVTKQVALARMMGHYAVEEAQRDAERRVQRANEVLANARVRPPEAAPPPPEESPSLANEKHEPSPEVFPEVAAHVAANGEASDPGDLAIPGYGSLSASQVVPRLAGLEPDQLEAVRRYEAATRARKTILGRIAQLQSEANT